MPSFVIDSMLGRLAKWLRIMGYDAEYYRDATDDDLLVEAKSKGAFLLTRDKQLSMKAFSRGVKVILLSEDLEEELLTLARLGLIRLHIDLDKTRCPLCNTPLKRVSSSLVGERLAPRAVIERYDTLWICPKCMKVYWPGSHLASMNSFLKKLRERLTH